jgi:hypothetical protein
MPSDAKVVAFPHNAVYSVADQLRAVADQIEAGEFGQVHSVSWVADCGDGQIQVGLVGNSPLPGPTAHLMLAMGMRKLEAAE